MNDMRKITAILPEAMVKAAMDNSGAGLTETLREALRQYNHRAASQRLLAMRGKIKFSGVTLDELREDKDHWDR